MRHMPQIGGARPFRGIPSSLRSLTAPRVPLPYADLVAWTLCAFPPHLYNVRLSVNEYDGRVLIARPAERRAGHVPFEGAVHSGPAAADHPKGRTAPVDGVRHVGPAAADLLSPREGSCRTAARRPAAWSAVHQLYLSGSRPPAGPFTCRKSPERSSRRPSLGSPSRER